MKNFEDWIDIFKRGFAGDHIQLPVIMVGGKLDLNFKRAVSNKEAFNIAKKNKLYGFIESSSKDGQNIEEIFYELTKLMMQRAEII